jgi:6-pyruvoyl-tetrahydropterin synthase
MRFITKSFTFHAAHRLRHSDRSNAANQAISGVCAFPQGHSRQLRVTLGGKVIDNGISHLIGSPKGVVRQSVLSRYDHGDLNTLPEYPQLPPTAEATAGSMLRLQEAETSVYYL